MKQFFLKWETETGRQFIARYSYDGLSNQSKFTEKGWKLHIIAHNKADGFRYLGQASETAYYAQKF